MWSSGIHKIPEARATNNGDHSTVLLTIHIKDSDLFYINENKMVHGWFFFLTWTPSPQILTEITPSRRYSHIYSILIESNLIDKLTVFPLRQDQYRRNGNKWKPWRKAPPLPCKVYRRICIDDVYTNGVFGEDMYRSYYINVTRINLKQF